MKVYFFKIAVIMLLSISEWFNCQDIDYNLIYDDGKGNKYYAKREVNNEIWFKSVGPDKKIRLKNGKTNIVKGEELKALYGCNCANNLIKNIALDESYKRIDNETLEQLLCDFSCSDLVYSDFIGNSEDGFNFYLGKIEENGNYKTAWVKSIVNEDRFIPEEGQEMIVVDPETGKTKLMKIENIAIESGYTINKYMLDCNNMKIGTIVHFNYGNNNLLSKKFHPEYFSHLGLRDVHFDSDKFIFDKVCKKK